MRTVRAWLVRLAGLARTRSDERKLSEEIRSHLELHVDDAVQRGLSYEEARREALKRFGGVEQAKEAWREQRRIRLVETISKDLVYAARTLRRRKGWTAVAILSLSLGIGANTALFNAAHGLLIEELAVRNPAELVAFRWTGPEDVADGVLNYGGINAGSGLPGGASFSNLAFEALRETDSGLSEVFAAAYGPTVSLVVDGRAEVASSQFVSGNYYRGLGVGAEQGRMLEPSDDDRAAPLAIVISTAYWERRFGRNPSIAGKEVQVNGIPAIVAGIEPPGLGSMARAGRPSPDVSLPIAVEARIRPNFALSDLPTGWWLMVMGRLERRSNIDAAESRLQPVFRQTVLGTLNEQTTDLAGTIPRLALVDGRRGIYDVTADETAPFQVLTAIFTVILLVVGLNVANLQLARSEGRRQELLIRAAIGAGRSRLVAHLLAESCLLGLMGGAAGLLVAFAGSRLLDFLSLPGAEFHFTIPLLAFALGLSLVTGLLFGIVPAVRATKLSRGGAIQTPTRSTSSRSWLARTMVVAQVALSLVLLVGAGLFSRTLVNAREVDTGFDSKNLALFTIDPLFVDSDETGPTATFERIRRNLEATPGVRSASFATQALLSGTGFWSGITSDSATVNRAATVAVSPSFFDTMGVPVLSGRGLSDTDTSTAPRVAVINEAAADALFPGVNPVGRTFGRTFDDVRVEVVGVVPDVRYQSVRDASPVMVFYPNGQEYGDRPQTFQVRTEAPPETLLPTIRAAVEQVANLPIENATTQRAEENDLLSRERMFAWTSTAFGALALLVASVGLFGLMSWAVARRTREIGIRMALGAEGPTLLGQTMRESLILVAIGALAGTAIALATTPFIESMLFGLEPHDPITFFLSIGVLGAATAAAAYIPARRAARVDPMIALRHE